MSKAWIGRPLYGWRSTPNHYRGSSYTVDCLHEPTGATERRPIGFRVDQARANRRANSARLVVSQIAAIYQ